MTTGRQPGVASDNKPVTELHDEAGDFLARWSRRKLEARTGSIDDSAEVLQTEEPQAVPPVAAPPERELTDADMPPLDSLTADSDFTPFMSPGVSDGLRRLALRKLFSQPSFNITDGLANLQVPIDDDAIVAVLVGPLEMKAATWFQSILNGGAAPFTAQASFTFKGHVSGTDHEVHIPAGLMVNVIGAVVE